MKFPYIKDPELVGKVHPQQPIRVLQQCLDEKADIWDDIPIAEFALVELYEEVEGQIRLVDTKRLDPDETVTRQSVVETMGKNKGQEE